jgi:hypothetical protein
MDNLKRNKDIADQLYLLLKDKLGESWKDLDLFDLKENMRKPLKDEKANSRSFKMARAVIPGFPFDIINKHIVKLKADPAKKIDHLKTYIFEEGFNESSKILDEFEQDLKGELCGIHAINKSRARADIFLKTLVYLAKECTFSYEKYPDEKDIIRKSRFFLIGEPGSGKTTFLNFLISVYVDNVLIPEKTMIIRIDLNDAINKEGSFEKLIVDKFYTVYREYFFKENIWRPDFDRLKNFIKEKRVYKEEEIEKLKNLDDQIEHFRSGSKSKLQQSFLQDLMEFLTSEQEVVYIFFIDGLDYVTLDDIHMAKFQEWLTQINDYILTKHSFRGSYVISMRDISYHKALKYMFGGSNEAWLRSKKVEIITCDFNRMMRKKIAMAKAEIMDTLRQMRNRDQARYQLFAWLLDSRKIEEMLNEYLAFVCLPFLNNREEIISEVQNQLDVRNKIIEPGLKKIKEISSNNYRCIMRNLKLVLDYLASTYSKSIEDLEHAFRLPLYRRLELLSGGSYRVLRCFIVGKREIEDYRTPYSYIPTSDKKDIIFVRQWVRFVIPPVTNFVYIYGHQDTSVRQFRGLLKIRLLQYLNAPNAPNTNNEIENFFHENFGYDMKYIKYDIDEMIYCQLLKVNDPVNYTYGEDSGIRITNLGRYIIDNIIYWYVYYESTLDALPVPESLSKQITPLNKNWRGVYLTPYVVDKAVGVMKYLKFMKFAEQQEIDKFRQIQANKADPKRRIDFDLYFTRVFEDIEKVSSEHILRNFVDRIASDKKNLIDHLARNYNVQLS